MIQIMTTTHSSRIEILETEITHFETRVGGGGVEGSSYFVTVFSGDAIVCQTPFMGKLEITATPAPAAPAAPAPARK